MLRNSLKNNSFVYEEEIDQNQLSKFQPISIEMISSIIIQFATGEQYDLSQSHPLYQSLFDLTSVHPNTIIEEQTLSLALPNDIDLPTFELFLTYISVLTPPKADLTVSKRLMHIAFFFQSLDQLKRIIAYNILPNIDKGNCLKIINDYLSFNSNEQLSETCNEMVETAITTAANNIFYLIYNERETLLSLPDTTLDEILEKYFESVILNQNIDHSLIINLMMSKRNINNDIFELLENERKYSINKFEKTCLDDLQSFLTWKIQAENPHIKGIYKESEEFIIKNVSIMLINYYDQTKDVFNMALKISEIKDCNESNTMTKEGSDINIHSTNPHIKESGNDKEKEKEKDYSLDDIDNSVICIGNNNCRKSTGGNSNTNNINLNQYASNSNSIQSLGPKFIISLLSICEIREIKHKSKINFNCIFSNSKTKVLITRIENFSKKFEENNIPFNTEQIEFTLDIFFSISYNFSSILTHICKNFYQYHTLPSLSIISKNVLNIMLRNEELNVNNEDEVMNAVLTWLKGKTHTTAEIIIEVVKNINWSLLSIEALFDFIGSQSKIILLSHDLQGIIAKEFQMRFNEEHNGNADIIMDDSSNNNNQSQSYQAIDSILKNVKVKRKYIREGSILLNMRSSSFSNDMIVNMCKCFNKLGSLGLGSNTIGLGNQHKCTSSPNFDLSNKEVLLNYDPNTNNNHNLNSHSNVEQIINTYCTNNNNTQNSNNNSSGNCQCNCISIKNQRNNLHPSQKNTINNYKDSPNIKTSKVNMVPNKIGYSGVSALVTKRNYAYANGHIQQPQSQGQGQPQAGKQFQMQGYNSNNPLKQSKEDRSNNTKGRYNFNPIAKGNSNMNINLTNNTHENEVMSNYNSNNLNNSNSQKNTTKSATLKPKEKDKKQYKSKSVINERKMQSLPNKQGQVNTQEYQSQGNESSGTTIPITNNLFPNYISKQTSQHKSKSTSKAKNSPYNAINNVGISSNAKSESSKKRVASLIELAKKEAMSPYNNNRKSSGKGIVESTSGITIKKKDESRPKSVI